MTASFPVVFLSGLLCDAELWAAQIEALGAEISPQVPDLTRQETITALAESVLAQAPPRFGLVALSMGGYVAFEMLRLAPERIVKACLFDTSARPDTPEQRQKRQLLVALSRQGTFKGVTPRFLPQLVHPSHLENGVLGEKIMTMAQRTGQKAYETQQKAIMDRPDSRKLLPLIRCPVSLYAGADDKITPPDMTQEIASLIPHATTGLIETCGHLPPLEQPEVTTELLRHWIEI